MLKILKNILLRIIVYPFCVFLFILSYYMVFDNSYSPGSLYDSRAILYGVGGLFFAPVYPIVDIIILIKTLFKKKSTI